VRVTGVGALAGSWRGTPAPTSPEVLTKFRRDRARMAQSIDRTVQRILDAVGPDTYVVLTSDNGFHLGQNGLGAGKGTAYRTDVQVPLLVVGPGVVPGERPQLTTNVDLAPTLEELAGLDPQRFRSGHSIVDTFTRPGVPSRRAVFFEHTGQASTHLDPDAALAGPELNRIPSYVAVRTRSSLLVRLDLDPDPVKVREAWEFYSYRDVGWERTNTYGDPAHRDEVQRLTRLLRQWDTCQAVTSDPVSRECRRLGGATR
jgi:N-acetylglucosamine-6-sulfatase